MTTVSRIQVLSNYESDTIRDKQAHILSFNLNYQHEPKGNSLLIYDFGENNIMRDHCFLLFNMALYPNSKREFDIHFRLGLLVRVAHVVQFRHLRFEKIFPRAHYYQLNQAQRLSVKFRLYQFNFTKLLQEICKIEAFPIGIFTEDKKTMNFQRFYKFCKSNARSEHFYRSCIAPQSQDPKSICYRHNRLVDLGRDLEFTHQRVTTTLIVPNTASPIYRTKRGLRLYTPYKPHPQVPKDTLMTFNWG